MLEVITPGDKPEKNEGVPCSKCGEITTDEKYIPVANGPDDFDLVPACSGCFESLKINRPDTIE